MRIVAPLLAAMVVALTGCAEADRAVDDAKREVREGVEKAKREFNEAKGKVESFGRAIGDEAERIRDDIESEVNQVLADIRGVVPQAQDNSEVPRSVAANTFQGFLTDVLDNVDGYWTETFRANDIPAPRVGYRWISPGQVVRTACNGVADDQAAFYCPADDSIYIGESIGRDILDNLGDFGVAYVVAHEYAHNVQQELGWYEEGGRFTTVAPFELQADCMAGAWGYAVYQEGRLEDADVEEAVQTAYAVGDFDVTNPQHHGTPDERADAWVSGYETGDPSSCTEFVTG